MPFVAQLLCLSEGISSDETDDTWQSMFADLRKTASKSHRGASGPTTSSSSSLFGASRVTALPEGIGASDVQSELTLARERIDRITANEERIANELGSVKAQLDASRAENKQIKEDAGKVHSHGCSRDRRRLTRRAVSPHSTRLRMRPPLLFCS